ncbi:hypothetical protein B9Z55_027476 [Caenorhabditis nigoni]|nr:hypothetical protein B9Z55_027476 [Caenorhabditis nigoni]
MGNELDDLMNRYQKFFEDLNENYVPMWNRYKRLCNQYLFYYIVGNLIGCMILFSNVIESFFYNTKQDSLKTFYGILQLFLLILSPFVHYRCIRTTILIDSLTQF